MHKKTFYFIWEHQMILPFLGYNMKDRNEFLMCHSNVRPLLIPYQFKALNNLNIILDKLPEYLIEF